jgi:putative DNA primase/helicase
MINVSSETPKKKQLNTDVVKAVVAGDLVTGRRPYQGPAKFKPYAKHYLAMNEIPLIDDPSHGMWRRIYILPFNRKFEEHEMDVDLTDKLKAELSGIFNWAIEGYKRLRERNFVFSVGNTMKQSKQNYRNQSNSVLDFAARRLMRSSNGDRLIFKDAYEVYRAFCQAEGYKKPQMKKEFKNILESIGYKIENSNKDANKVCIFGVTFHNGGD